MGKEEIKVIKTELNKWILDNSITEHQLKNKTRSGLPFGYGIVCYLLYGTKIRVNNNNISPRKMKEIIDFFNLEDDFIFDGEKWNLI